MWQRAITCPAAVERRDAPEHDRGTAAADREVEVVRILVGTRDDGRLAPGVAAEIAVNGDQIGELCIPLTHGRRVAGGVAGEDAIITARPGVELK